MRTKMNIFEMMHETFKFDKTKPIRLFEAFAGYGSQSLALKRLGLNVEMVGYSEIDKYAIDVYSNLHGENKNYGGIGSFDRFPKNIDICTWSFPCQDISLAGKQKGMVDGSRSNYGYIFLDTVKNTPKEERPKVLLMENVKALFSRTFKHDWETIQAKLEKMGYTSYSKVLNAKDYGIPQNRERVFIVSILGDYYYEFPKSYELEKYLLDFLEEEVDEKYFLSDKFIKNMLVENAGGFNRKEVFERNIKYNPKEEVANTITTREGNVAVSNFILIPEKTKKGYAKAHNGDGIYINRPHQKRGVVQSGMVPTIKTSPNDIGVVVKQILENKEKLRIRKLTPRECFRLMDVLDSDIDIILNTVSNSQAYKLAGNSIVVNVLVEIFKKLF